MPQQSQLFDKMTIPSFDGMLPSEAWDACEDWTDWAYSEADSFSEEQWDEVVCIMRNNYSRYYAKYENGD